MALYNRSIIYSTTGDVAAAVLDLQRLLEMDDVAANVRTEAKRKLVRMQPALDRSEVPDQPPADA